MHGFSPPLPLALLIVFGSAKIMAEIFERLGQPGLVGEIIAGAIIGPGVLGWIAPNDTLKALADLGVMFLLFDIGLQVKASELMRVGATAALVACLGLAVSFAAGWGVASLWHSPPAEALFMGASIMATSVGISASTLAARGLLNETASKIILSAAVIDDILGLIALAVVSSVVRGHVNVLEIVLAATLATAFIAVMARWGPSAARRILPHFRSKARSQEAQFHISLVLLFGLAAVAIYVGIAAIVGAFLAGLALSENADPRVRDLTRGVNELLVPFFLVGIGMNLNFAVFRSPSALGLTAAILAVALVSKPIGCGLAAVRLGWPNMLKIGLGMVPRLEVGIVVAQLGLSLAVISQEVYGTMVFTAVATTLATPLLLKIAFRD